MVAKNGKVRANVPAKIIFSNINYLCTFVFCQLLIIELHVSPFIIFDYDPKTLISVSITGLSFSLALFVATKNLYSDEDLSFIYGMSKTESRFKSIFDEIFGLFVWTAFLWLLTALGSMLSFLKLPVKSYPEYLSYQLYKLVLMYLLTMATLNLFSLVLDICRNTKLSVIRKYDFQEKHKDD